MKKGMCIAYEVGVGLYINITNRCTNRCSFCIRNNADGAYGSDSLWLEREPDTDEILKAIFSKNLEKYDEIVFCGYGEPAERLEIAVLVAKQIRKKTRLPIRINTNGQSDLILGRDTSEMFSVFDTVSVSLNAPNSARYDEICHSVYKEKAFESILKFAENVKKCVQNVHFSVVKDFLSEEEIEQCREISQSLGIPLRIRDYISSETP